MYKILVADDHPLFRDAIVNIIGIKFPGSTTYETEDIDSTLAFLKDNDDIDLILLDLNMPGMSNLNGLLDLRNQCPTTPVVIVSAEQEKQKILQTLSYGAVGFIAKARPSISSAAVGRSNRRYTSPSVLSASTFPG